MNILDRFFFTQMFGMIPNSKPPGWDHGSFMKISSNWRVLPHWSFSLEVVTYALQWPNMMNLWELISGMQEVCLCFFILRFLSAPVPQVYPLHSMPEKINSVNPASILALHVSWLTRRHADYIWGMSNFFGGALIIIPSHEQIQQKKFKGKQDFRWHWSPSMIIFWNGRWIPNQNCDRFHLHPKTAHVPTVLFAEANSRKGNTYSKMHGESGPVLCDSSFLWMLFANFEPLTHPGIGRNPLSHYTPNNG